MAERSRIIKVANYPIGSGPALAYYFEKMNLVQTIDEYVPIDKRRSQLSHGQGVAALVAMVLNHGHALYQLEKWAKNNKILSTIFADIAVNAYTDDRLADTLDALYHADLDIIQAALTVSMIKGFSLKVEAVHHDTTTFSFYGAYKAEAEKIGNGTGKNGLKITNGFSKDHRPDLKQIVYALSVNEDQIPLFGQALDGDYSDGPNYLEHWIALSRILPTSDFLYLGDSKLATVETLRYIIDHEGFFLSAQALCKNTKKEVAKALKKAKWNFIPFKPIAALISEEEVKGYSYIKAFFQIADAIGGKYRIRRLIIRSEQLAKKHEAKRQSHMQKVENGLQKIAGKLNRYKLKSQEQIKKAIDALFNRYPQAKGLITFKLRSQKIEVRHSLSRGRPKVPKVPKVEAPNTVPTSPTSPTRVRIETQTVYSLSWKKNKRAIKEASLLDGIFLRITNATEERLPDALMLTKYKEQWKVERQHRLLKGPIALTPVFLHKPQRIAALAFICLIAVQLLRLMEMEAAKALFKSNETLIGLYPNRIATANPNALLMLKALSTIEVIAVHERNSNHRDRVVNYMLTSLNPLQRKILALLGVPLSYYSQRKIFMKLKILKI